MEKIHRTASRPWISKRVNVREFRDSWDVTLANNKNFDLKNLLDEAQYSSIENECSPATMKCAYQHHVETSVDIDIPYFEDVVENVQLETLRLQLEDMKRRKNEAHYDSMTYQTTKFNNYPLQQNILAADSSKSVDFVPIEKPEVILTVQIFRPERRFQNGGKGPCVRFPMFHVDQEFLVLGSQFLTEIRDKIDCVSDRAIPGDLSENPFSPPDTTCKELYKSGFFYIDGLFFNDMRHPDCRDYSDIIINWSKRKQSGIGPFHKRRMEHSKFIDLEIQLGYPYLYVHQGNCEHFLVFTDMIMFSDHHNQNKAEYPLRIRLKPKKRTFCMVCHIHIAEWIVYKNKRLPENPFYFCKSCFFNFNYDENNKKIGEFEAYRHIDRSVLM